LPHPSICCLETEFFRIELSASGTLAVFADRVSGVDYLAEGVSAPLLQIVADGDVLKPEHGVWDEDNGSLMLRYDGERYTARIAVWFHASHAGFELTAIEGPPVDLVIWGPYPITIGDRVGETVGMARSADFAIGIQALTMRTIGGYPEECPKVGFGEPLHTAATTPFGSALQAFGRASDGPLPGSRIALFGCPADQALAVIGRIEQTEGLPHPMLDGAWAKTAQTARLSYLITDFGEETIDTVIAYTRKAGFSYLYHEDPFHTWGHFQLKPDAFPDGDKSLRRCVESAEQAGLRIGIHTLSNFITPNDPYVSPVPDPRLMRSGGTRISAPVSPEDTEIGVLDPVPFRDRGTLATVALGNELIQYRVVSDAPPYTLLGCRRGVFGTKVSAHPANTEIGKLSDHPYRVFFPNMEMLDELADRLVELFNQTGLRQISFDGLEGCGYTGHDRYAHHRFVERCYRGWEGEVVNDASRLSHYLWHIHTRMNWGEPWGKAAREGMPEYRFRNQSYFDRNLFPRMLGWFQLRLDAEDLPATTLDDIEWTLARCAGFDAGFALSANLRELSGNGCTDTILTSIRHWETARLSHAFTDAQREKLRDSDREFHLETIAENRWWLYEVAFSPIFTHRPRPRQPGEPDLSLFTWKQPFRTQIPRITLHAAGSGDIVNPAVTLYFDETVFPVALRNGEYLVCDDGRYYRICDENRNVLREGVLSSPLPETASGSVEIGLRCDAGDGRLEVRLSALDDGEAVGG